MPICQFYMRTLLHLFIFAPLIETLNFLTDYFLVSLLIFLYVLFNLSMQTFSQLCDFNYETKTVQVYKAPWYISDKPKFVYRGLMLGEHNSLFHKF